LLKIKGIIYIKGPLADNRSVALSYWDKKGRIPDETKKTSRGIVETNPWWDLTFGHMRKHYTYITKNKISEIAWDKVSIALDKVSLEHVHKP